MKKLVIIGAGGHGRCCLDIARTMKRYEEIVFADDGCIGNTVNDIPVVYPIKDVFKLSNTEYEIFVAIGNNLIRKEIMTKLKEKGYSLASLISPKCYISGYASIGEGSVIYPNVVVEANAKVGKGCIVTSNASINHDAMIKDFCLIYSNSVIRPNVVLEDLVKIGSGCVISFGTTIISQKDILDGTVI